MCTCRRLLQLSHLTARGSARQALSERKPYNLNNDPSVLMLWFSQLIFGFLVQVPACFRDWNMMRVFLICLLSFCSTVAIAEPINFERVMMRQGTAPTRPDLNIGDLEKELIAGTWQAPAMGENTDRWQTVSAEPDGWIRDDRLISGYAYAEIEVEEDGVWLLDAMGYASVYVNGTLRIGNIYAYSDTWESWEPHFDYAKLPIPLKAGNNTFLFYGSRYGLMKAQLTRMGQPLQLNASDATLPDLVVGEETDSWGSVVVINGTDDVVADATLTVAIDGEASSKTRVPPLPPHSVHKVGFALRAEARPETGNVSLNVTLARDGQTLDSASFGLEVKEPHENRRVTFVSNIDDSVQYYGFLPSSGEPGPKALFLSLHGASVEAINQSGSYAALNWGHIVAPTNRRPFGFSWEDWGRLDALEVLAHARAQLDIADDRIYLTGHSMGGHGSWQLGSLYPDKFAAVGPSAGWITIWSYRRHPRSGESSPLAAMVERGTLSSETLEMAPNLAGVGVYVLHGSDDDNVPPEQSYLMLDRLAEFHKDYVYHEEPGVGHWWDLSDDPGADCVSWPPMFDFFARHRLPAAAEVRHLSFRTPSPSISAWHQWACVGAQESQYVMSEIEFEREESWSRLSGTTENVTVVGFDLAESDHDSVAIEIDGQALVLAVPDYGPLWLERGDIWRQVDQPNEQHKGLHNNGGFRSVFNHRVQLVYATGGDDAENRWARTKARYDAEHLWYQGNASVEVLPDTLFDPVAEADRNVVLYGNASTHEDWQELWTAPVVVDRGSVTVGDHSYEGADLGVLAVSPRPGSASNSVAIVAATGAVGQQLMNRRPYLKLGVSYPDVTVFEFSGVNSVVAGAGYFGNDWSLETGEFIWEDGR
ncbi:MAG: dienelactone hydrolase [Candidatus Krumholzibacteriia bacterium]|jgi:dienelactone hydrolase